MQKNEVGLLSLCDVGLIKGFLAVTPKAQTTKEKKID